jgi:hypothetical protein
VRNEYGYDLGARMAPLFTFNLQVFSPGDISLQKRRLLFPLDYCIWKSGAGTDGCIDYRFCSIFVDAIFSIARLDAWCVATASAAFFKETAAPDRF